jgi:hypothetical protein
VGAVTVRLTARREAGHFFSRRERRRMEMLAGVFANWFSRTARDLVRPDRRATARPFGQVLDHTAALALRDGRDVSVVVVAVPSLAGRSSAIQQWVIDMGTQLRGSDVAGALSTCEIGVLLYGASREHARVVIERLRRHLDFGRALPDGTIGTASRRAGELAEPSLVDAARADALQSRAGWPYAGEMTA